MYSVSPKKMSDDRFQSANASPGARRRAVDRGRRRGRLLQPRRARHLRFMARTVPNVFLSRTSFLRMQSAIFATLFLPDKFNEVFTLKCITV